MVSPHPERYEVRSSGGFLQVQQTVPYLSFWNLRNSNCTLNLGRCRLFIRTFSTQFGKIIIQLGQRLHVQCNLSRGTPTLWQAIKKQINELKSKWALKSTPGDAEGVQVGFAESLQDHVVRLQQNGEIRDGQTIRIKLTGDGTNIGKRLTVNNFTFTLLNEKEVAVGKKRNYVLAILKTTETLDNLRDSREDLRLKYQT